MPLLPGLRVMHSRIHGYGLVATRAFRKGEFLVQGDGVLYREHEEFDDTYALVLPGYETDAEGNEGPPLFWDLADQTRWINHSCAPNAEVGSQWDPEHQIIHAWWYALRDIEPGEELSYDYAFSATVAEPCACGAATCRGLIVDPAEIDQVPESLRPYLRVASKASGPGAPTSQREGADHRGDADPQQAAAAIARRRQPAAAVVDRADVDTLDR